MRQIIDRLLSTFWSVSAAGFQSLNHILNALWRRPQLIWSVVKPTRFSAFTILAGWLLLFSDQGQELAVRLGDDGSWHSMAMIYFLLPVSWCAFQAWHWARVALFFVHGRNYTQHDWLVRWLPSLYACLTFLAAVASLLNANLFAHAAAAGVFGGLISGLLAFRDPIGKSLASKVNQVRGGATFLSAFEGSERPSQFRELPPVTIFILGFSVLFAVATLLAVIFWPVKVGQGLGASAIAFLAFGNIIPIGSLAVIWSHEAGFPVITTVMAAVVAFSCVADNHLVPTINEKNLPKRFNTEAAADAWLSAVDDLTPTNFARPVIFVSTAGGGLRAAYWTATVLGSLQDDCPAFINHTFSISGVSGGSVGAAMFATAMYSGFAPAPSAKCQPDATTAKVEPFLHAVLARDFLGPTIAAMLYPDLVQRFIPYPIMPDRGSALVEAWDNAWKNACRKNAACKPTDDGLQASFLKIAGLPGSQRPWRPILLFNGTHQETGKRLIASNIKILPDVFLDAFDLHHMLGRDVSMGVAALNSARFTYVSPAGRLVRATDGKEMGHVLDGGYFENYGAITNAEIARAAVKRFEKAGKAIRPIVIQISSDPALFDRDLPVSHKNFLNFDSDGQEKVSLFLNEIAGPVRGLLHTRSARGVLANKTVADIVDSLRKETHRFPTVIEPVFVHFRICADKDADPPLGWSMAQNTRNLLDELVNSGCDNKKIDNANARRKVLNALRNLIPVHCVQPGSGNEKSQREGRNIARCYPERTSKR